VDPSAVDPDVSGWSPGQNRERARQYRYERERYERERFYQSPPRSRSRPQPPPAPPPPTREERIRAAAKVLGVSWPATREQVTKAFRKAVLKSHPDLGGTDAAVKEVIKARDELLAAV
jgi:hypothetical protein